jgi:glucosamine--fructose-6-phosphate aminotransferase (isomerizing)
VVHNGIIENYKDIIDYLEMSERGMSSDTDTEVIAHLIDSAEADTLYEKVQQACSLLEGSYAFVAMDKNDTETLVVARKDSPLIVAHSDDGAIIASDIQAVLQHTDKMTVLSDHEIAVVTKDKIKIFALGEEVYRDPLEIPWSVAKTQKGQFDTYMHKEIREQPVAIYDTMLHNIWPQVAGKVFEVFAENMILDMIFTACGTSYHACMVGALAMEGVAGVRSRTKLASEIKSGTVVGPNTLVVAVSQSGETADTLSAIKHVRSKGAKVISVVNTMGSSIERESDFTIHTAAGPEISVASTKAFTAQLTVLYMLAGMIASVNMGAQPGAIEQGRELFRNIQEEIYRCADEMPSIFGLESKVKKVAKEIKDSRSILYLGRALNFPTALEGALKLKEISYIHAEGFAAGEMKHGSIALIEDGTPVVVIAPEGPTYMKMLSNIEEAKTRGAKIIAITSEGDTHMKDVADHVIQVPKVGELFVPMMAVVPLQLLAYYTAKELERDIDKPRNLAKSVTVE